MKYLLAAALSAVVTLCTSCVHVTASKSILKTSFTIDMGGRVHHLHISEIDGQTVDINQTEVALVPGFHMVNIIDQTYVSQLTKTPASEVRPISMQLYLEPNKEFDVSNFSADLQMMEVVMSWKYE